MTLQLGYQEKMRLPIAIHSESQTRLDLIQGQVSPRHSFKFNYYITQMVWPLAGGGRYKFLQVDWLSPI